MFFVISLVVTLFGVAAICNLIKRFTGIDVVSLWVTSNPASVWLAIAAIVIIIVVVRRRRR